MYRIGPVFMGQISNLYRATTRKSVCLRFEVLNDVCEDSSPCERKSWPAVSIAEWLPTFQKRLLLSRSYLHDRGNICEDLNLCSKTYIFLCFSVCGSSCSRTREIPTHKIGIFFCNFKDSNYQGSHRLFHCLLFPPASYSGTWDWWCWPC